MSQARERGRLVVLSGPSGAGKTTVCDRLLEEPEIVRAITATTRPPRDGEVEGVHYYFLDEESFRRDIEQGRFIEYAEVYDRWYGTPEAPLEKQLATGRTVLLNIDVQGAEELMDRGVKGLYLFIEPPDLEELRRRLLDGEDFAALAGEYSDDPVSAEQGGALGWASRGDYVDAFSDALFGLETGEISAVVRTEFGFHIIRLDAINSGALRTFEEVHDELREELTELRDQVTGAYENTTDIRYGASRGWVDAIIEPAETRGVLIAALESVTRYAEERPFITGVLQV